jgi:hypothetical protein
MNFYDLSAKLRAIEENAPVAPPAPVAEKPFFGNHTLVAPRPDGKFDVMDSASGNVHHVGTYDTLAQANEAAKDNDEIVTKVVATMKEQASNECGDMMPMMSHAPQQQDSVTMNVSMNGSGPGGIKDLMSILRNIEQSAEHDHAEPMIAQPHGMDGDVDIVLGTADEDMLSNADADESYGNSAPGGSDAHTYGIDAVTRKGDDMHSKGDVKRLRVNGGENPLQEGLVERLSAMYQSIKEAKGKRTMSRAAKGYMKYGKKGMKALADAGREGKDLEPIQDKFNKYK